MVEKNKTEDRLKSDLLKLFTDMNAEGLSVKDIRLYNRIKAYARNHNKDYIELIYSWGFSFKPRKNISMTLDDILITTLNLYPEKIIDSIADYKTQNYTMYQRLMSLLNRKMTPSQYLISNGFTFKNRSSKAIPLYTTKINTDRIKGYYDKFAVAELINHFVFNQKKFAESVGVSREYIRKCPTYFKIDNNTELMKEILEDDELDAVTNTINKRLFENTENGYTVRIVKKKEESISDYSDCAIIISKDYTAKCFLSLPDYIIEMIEVKGLIKYNNKDFQVLNYMDDNETSWKINDNEEIEFIGDEINRLINIGQHSYSPNGEKTKKLEYVKYLTGYDLVSRKPNEADILEIIKKNVYDEKHKYVSIPSLNHNKSDYMKLRREFQNRNMSSLGELISSYGYIYRPQRKKELHRETNSISEYINILDKYYIVEDKKVYLKTTETFTKRLSAYAWNHKMSLNELLNQIGYIRITSKELPDSYIYTPYLVDKTNTLIEKVLDKINEIQTNGVIDLTNNDTLNYEIRKVADMENKTMDEWLGIYGYIRRDSHNFNNSSNYTNESNDDSDSEKYDVNDFDKKLLSEIKEIQGSLNINISVPNERVERNKQLVSKLKRLYNYRCQLCDPKGNGFIAPIIEMNNGKAYVELHHIKYISNALLPENLKDESNEELDSYSNAIILCSHHHSYVHYHKNGFKELYKNDLGEVYLLSDSGEFLRVYTNKHLLID